MGENYYVVFYITPKHFDQRYDFCSMCVGMHGSREHKKWKDRRWKRICWMDHDDRQRNKNLMKGIHGLSDESGSHT